MYDTVSGSRSGLRDILGCIGQVFGGKPDEKMLRIIEESGGKSMKTAS